MSQIATQNMMYRQNITIIKFIVEIIKQLNEITSSLNENPEILLKIISDHFGQQTGSLFEKDFTEYSNNEHIKNSSYSYHS